MSNARKGKTLVLTRPQGAEEWMDETAWATLDESADDLMRQFREAELDTPGEFEVIEVEVKRRTVVRSVHAVTKRSDK